MVQANVLNRLNSEHDHYSYSKTTQNIIIQPRNSYVNHDVRQDSPEKRKYYYTREIDVRQDSLGVVQMQPSWMKNYRDM